MNGEGDLTRKRKSRINWKRLFIVLAAGVVPTAIPFIFDWWWVGTACLLVTLLAACFTLSSALYPAGFTLYTVLAIAWVSGSILDGVLPAAWELGPVGRIAISAIAGISLGVVVSAGFWLMVLFVSTKWVLGVSSSLAIPWKQAFKLVATRAFGTSQPYVVVENGKLVAERPRGVLSKLGGPGVLVVRPGNAVVLERAGKVTRIEGPGVYTLKRFESLKQPVDKKGIVDLRRQWASATAENVLTKDGIPLQIKVGMGYQIEPKDVTGRRPSSHFEGGEATSRVLGDQYSVYEATVRKAVFATTADGWQSLFPGAPISILRDVMAAYTLDQIFPHEESTRPNPDRRAIKAVEGLVIKRTNVSWAGVSFSDFDILEVSVPQDVLERMLRRWTIAVEGRLRIQEAEAERDALIQLSEGRAHSLRTVEAARLQARKAMLTLCDSLMHTLAPLDQDQLVIGFCSVIQELTSRVGQDEAIAMRYIEAMQAIVQSPGPKSFVITPPNPSPGMLPTPPRPTPTRFPTAIPTEGGEKPST